ncbi:Dehydrogenase [Exophiala dermatitidis]
MTNTNGVTGLDGVNGTDGSGKSGHVSVEEFVQQQSYDYIICGGGTAGLTVAARLTENPEVTVGVIEAGKNRLGDALVDTPALFLQMLGNKEYDWTFDTVPQVGNKSKIHHVPRGRALGGSSAINYMMYVRGSDQDYDDWAELANDPAWSSAKLKEYMRKHQSLEPIDEQVIDRTCMPFVGDNHGTSGPVRTSFNDFRLPLEDDIVKAADQATGFDKKPIDPWSGDHIGFYNTLGTVVRTGADKGKRSYAARGYFQANQHRPNLKVITESLVSRVILDKNKTATGVEFIHNGHKYTIRAHREVIVAGGAINTPQILELSGIGDPKVLEAAGIECLVDLPSVGTNYQDHVVSAIVYQLAPDQMSGDSIYKPEVMAEAQKALAEMQGGPLTAIQSVQGFFPCSLFLEPGELDEIVAFIRKTQEDPSTPAFQKKQLDKVIAHLRDPHSANLQFVFIAATADMVHGVQDQSKLWPPPSDTSGSTPDGITLAVCVQYPVSRGHVHVRSADPTVHPEVDPGYLSHEADVAVLAAGIKFIESLARAPALQGKLGPRIQPSRKDFPHLDAVDARRAAVREFCLGEYHSCGSCAMGETVDSRLRVLGGVEKLRVVDASVFPNNVSGNIVSSVYMLAEKAADLIKEDWEFDVLGKVKAQVQAKAEKGP